MAVTNQQIQYTYIADGRTTVFPFSCRVILESDLLVSIDGVKVINYTIQGLNSDDGGNIVFNTAPSTGSVVFILRDIQLERETEYQTNGDFLAKTVNRDFDRIWMAIQGVLGWFKRALSYPLGGTNYDAEKRRIENLADPVNDQDAATKFYVNEEDKRVKDYVDVQDKILDDKINEVGNTNIGRILASYPNYDAIKKVNLNFDDVTLSSGLYLIDETCTGTRPYISKAFLFENTEYPNGGQVPINKGTQLLHLKADHVGGIATQIWMGHQVQSHRLGFLTGYQSTIDDFLASSGGFVFFRNQTTYKNIDYGNPSFDWSTWDGVTYDPEMPVCEDVFWGAWEQVVSGNNFASHFNYNIDQYFPTYFDNRSYISNFSSLRMESKHYWADQNSTGHPPDPLRADSRYIVDHWNATSINNYDDSNGYKGDLFSYWFVTEVLNNATASSLEKLSQPRTWIGVSLNQRPYFKWFRTDTPTVNDSDIMNILAKFGYASDSAATILADGSGKTTEIDDFAAPKMTSYGEILPLVSGNYIAYSSVRNPPPDATSEYHFQVTVKPAYPTVNSGGYIRDLSIYDVIEVPPISSANPRPHTGKRWTGLFSQMAAGNNYQVVWKRTDTSSSGNGSKLNIVRKEKILNGLVENGTLGIFKIPDNVDSVEITACGAGGGGGNSYVSTLSDGQYGRVGQQATAFIDLKVKLQDGFRYLFYNIPAGAHPGVDGGPLVLDFMNTDDESQLKSIRHDSIVCSGGSSGGTNYDNYINNSSHFGFSAVYKNAQLDETKYIETFGKKTMLVKSPSEVGGTKYDTHPLPIEGLSDVRYGVGGAGRGPNNSTGTFGGDGFLKISWYEIE